MEVIERLRRAREKAGLSLEELAARTKIQFSILEAIEAGDFQRVPGGLFVRGFLRAYAREVGLDPEGVVAQYLEEFEPALTVEPEEVVSVADVKDVKVAPPEDEPAAWSWRKVWPAAFMGGVLIAVLSALGTDTETVQPVEAGAVGTSGQVAAPAQQPAAPARPETLTLDIRAKRAVWVAVTADGHKAVYRVLQPDERVKVQARQEIAARIGDAEAFDYSINGVAGKPLGAAAEVKDIVITPDNYLSYKPQQ